MSNQNYQNKPKKERNGVIDLLLILTHVVMYLMLWVLMMYGLYTGFMSVPVFLCALFVSVLGVIIEIQKLFNGRNK